MTIILEIVIIFVTIILNVVFSKKFMRVLISLVLIIFSCLVGLRIGERNGHIMVYEGRPKYEMKIIYGSPDEFSPNSPEYDFYPLGPPTDTTYVKIK